MSKHFTKPFNPIGWQGSPHDFSGDNNLGIYATEATQRFVYGTRYLTWDGRVYKYANAGAAITTAHVDYAVYWAADHRSDWYQALPAAITAGDTSVLVDLTGGSSETCDEDELAGGYVFLMKLALANQCIRQIVGNTKNVSTETIIYLEAPVSHAFTKTTDHFEILANPWADIRSSYATGTTTTTMAGMPVVTCAASSKTWIQTWGICRGSWVGPAATERSLYYHANGSFAHYADIAAGTDQVAGVCILPGTDHSAFFMLQLSI